MRACLADMLNVEPKQLHFTRGVKGKPQIISSEVDYKLVGFNVSHQVSVFRVVFVTIHLYTDRGTTQCLLLKLTAKVVTSYLFVDSYLVSSTPYMCMQLVWMLCN